MCAYRYKRGLLTREALDAILLTQGLALTVCIDLGDNDLALGVFKRICELFILGREVFAVTAIRARHYTEHSSIVGYYTTYHQGAKLKSHEFKFRRLNSYDTYNSTSAGTPFPIVLSQVDGTERSLTFVRVSGPECARTSAPRPRVKKKEVTFMVSGEKVRSVL